jgi:hypothetical protein
VFATAFDEALAHRGPPAVFLPDREGRLRFDADWTRDCWERAEGTLDAGWSWVLLRDRATGFVNLLLVTSPGLLVAHPRGDVRTHPSRELADAELLAFGRPPVARAPW